MAARKSKIEFLPQEEWEKKPFGKFLKWALTIGRHIVIVTEFIVILAFVSRFKLDRDLANLNEEIKQQQAIVTSSSQFEQEFRFLQKQMATIENLREKELKTSSILNELAGLTPVDISLADFQVAESQVSLSATALSESGLAVFLQKLTASPHFDKVLISSLTSGEKKGVGIQFEVKGELVR